MHTEEKVAVKKRSFCAASISSCHFFALASKMKFPDSLIPHLILLGFFALSCVPDQETFSEIFVATFGKECPVFRTSPNRAADMRLQEPQLMLTLI